MGKRREPRSVGELEGVAGGYLEKYTDPAGRFAFATYDRTPIHEGDITPADVLMANLLSLRLGWRDVVPVFVEQEGKQTPLRQALNEALAAARRLPALEDCTEEQAEMSELGQANWMAWGHPLEGRKRAWTQVTVSKVLHCLSPNVPLFDSVVAKFYAERDGGAPFRQRLRADLIANRGWLSELAAKHEVHEAPLALTRVEDIVIWIDNRSG